MEGLIDLLPLLFIGAYYLLRARSRSKQQKRAVAPQQELVSDGEPRRESPFQSFMSQIEDAMAEAAGEPIDPDPAPALPPPALPPAVSTSATVPDLAAADAEFHPTLGSFDSAAPVDHEAHGFGPDNPLSEEAFEQRPAFFQPLDSALPASSPREYDPHGLRQRAGAGPGPTADWRQRLESPQAAQDAFVLQTVFGPRGGRLAEHRR